MMVLPLRLGDGHCADLPHCRKTRRGGEGGRESANEREHSPSLHERLLAEEPWFASYAETVGPAVALVFVDPAQTPRTRLTMLDR